MFFCFLSVLLCAYFYEKLCIMVLVFPLRSLRLCGEITPFTIFKRLK